MYAAIRQGKAKTGMAEELTRRIKEGAIPIISDVEGFMAYYVVYASDDTVTAIGIFNNFAGAEESNRRGLAWSEQNLAPLLIGPATAIAGPVIVHAVGITRAGQVLCRAVACARRLLAQILNLPAGASRRRLRGARLLRERALRVSASIGASSATGICFGRCAAMAQRSMPPSPGGSRSARAVCSSPSTVPGFSVEHRRKWKNGGKRDGMSSSSAGCCQAAVEMQRIDKAYPHWRGLQSRRRRAPCAGSTHWSGKNSITGMMPYRAARSAMAASRSARRDKSGS